MNSINSTRKHRNGTEGKSHRDTGGRSRRTEKEGRAEYKSILAPSNSTDGLSDYSLVTSGCCCHGVVQRRAVSTESSKDTLASVLSSSIESKPLQY